MISFDVIGVPVAQGSMRGFVVNGRAVVTAENKAPLRSWRDSVAGAAAAAAREQGERFPRPMPVTVTAIFRLPRPKTQTKAQRAVPLVSVKPDIDKLGRALLDALSASHVFDDDAQVSRLWLTKLYAPSEDTLGAYITVGTA